MGYFLLEFAISCDLVILRPSRTPPFYCMAGMVHRITPAMAVRARRLHRRNPWHAAASCGDALGTHTQPVGAPHGADEPGRRAAPKFVARSNLRHTQNEIGGFGHGLLLTQICNLMRLGYPSPIPQSSILLHGRHGASHHTCNGRARAQAAPAQSMACCGLLRRRS